MSKAMMLIALAGLAGCSLLKGKEPEAAPPQPRFQTIAPLTPLAGTISARLALINANGQVKHSDPIWLDFRLENVSQADAVIFNELDLGWLVAIEFVDARGAPVSPAQSKQKPAGALHYVVLPPHRFVGRMFGFRHVGQEWSLKPGKYFVRVVYRNPDAKFCVVSPGLTPEDVRTLGEKALIPVLTGQIISNVVEFEVLPLPPK
jgi:hypothetical protein